jgi:non-specific serine/threonine protein kinase
VLRVGELPGKTITTSLSATVAQQQLLLVLDNCEHVIDACAGLVSTLLEMPIGVRILATSREALGVAGETVRLLAPLAVPDLEQPRKVEQLRKYGSVQLLLDRAAAQGAEFDPVDAGPALCAICVRLDGLPLALELAAARLPALGPHQLAQRLDDAFRMLGEAAATHRPATRRCGPPSIGATRCYLLPSARSSWR